MLRFLLAQSPGPTVSAVPVTFARAPVSGLASIMLENGSLGSQNGENKLSTGYYTVRSDVPAGRRQRHAGTPCLRCAFERKMEK